jgi:hypothetical protein
VKVLSLLAVVCALLYWELTALLFVISTLAMCILLLVVAFADLEGRNSELHKQLEKDPAPKIESDVLRSSSSQATKRHKGAA